jgi:hypothetical protein
MMREFLRAACGAISRKAIPTFCGCNLTNCSGQLWR